VFVYVVEKGKVHKKEVTTGISDGEWMEITDGVKAGDKVVKNPSSKVMDGMEVDVRD
jgi:HlyD family secretion protein